MPEPEAVLRELGSEAMRAMEQASGGSSVCSFTKAGVSVPGVKYAEGRWAALRELRSQGVESASAATAAGAAAATLADLWRGHLADVQQTGASRDWVAYRSGGIDALTEFEDRVRYPH